MLLITGAPCRDADILTVEVFVILLGSLFRPGAVTTTFLLAVAREGIPCSATNLEAELLCVLLKDCCESIEKTVEEPVCSEVDKTAVVELVSSGVDETVVAKLITSGVDETLEQVVSVVLLFILLQTDFPIAVLIPEVTAVVVFGTCVVSPSGRPAKVPVVLFCLLAVFPWTS